MHRTSITELETCPADVEGSNAGLTSRRAALFGCTVFGGLQRRYDGATPMALFEAIHRGEGETGVLLLHGLTGTPYEVAGMAEALAEHGHAVRAPYLAGHHDMEVLECTSWREWYRSAEAAFDALHARGQRRIVVVGFSMGALLALRLAALRGLELRGVVAISVPLAFERWKRTAISTLARMRSHPRLRSVVGVLPKRGGPDVRIRREAETSPSMRGIPYPALAELVALQGEVRELLPHVRVPLLLVHGRFDHTTPPEQSRRVAQRVSSARVEVRILPHSFHIVGVDLDRTQLGRDVVEFVDSVLHEP